MSMPKLVRDKIPDIIKESGKTPIYHVATEFERKEAVIAKIREEVAEFEKDPSLEEAADVYHAFMQTLTVYGMTWDQVIQAAVAKSHKRGRFSEMYILDAVID